jgi:hypothetical protein
MLVTERDAGDFQRLQELTDQEHNALQRDRYSAVLLAVNDGDLPHEWWARR